MTLSAWRIVKARHADTAFDGEGARRYGGRWNSPGTALVYTASSRALAALELLVHLPSPALLGAFVCRRVDFKDTPVSCLDAAELPPDWRAEPVPASTQALGDAWARAGNAVVLQVPSAVVPAEANYLFNPAHPDFSKLVLGPAEPFAFDPRLGAKPAA